MLLNFCTRTDCVLVMLSVTAYRDLVRVVSNLAYTSHIDLLDQFSKFLGYVAVSILMHIGLETYT